MTPRCFKWPPGICFTDSLEIKQAAKGKMQPWADFSLAIVNRILAETVIWFISVEKNVDGFLLLANKLNQLIIIFIINLHLNSTLENRCTYLTLSVIFYYIANMFQFDSLWDSGREYSFDLDRSLTCGCSVPEDIEYIGNMWCQRKLLGSLEGKISLRWITFLNSTMFL